MQRIKILINGITLDGANLVPLLLKVKFWQEKNCEVTFFGNEMLQKQIDSLSILEKYNFIELKNTRRIKSRIHLIYEGSRRNLMALSYLGKLKNKFDVVYSISSVLDLMLLPFILKKLDSSILRIAVFDNIVPIIDPGNRLIRLLAWVFFQISVSLLKDTDLIFTGSKDLEDFLISKGIERQKVIEHGQAVRNEMIQSAKKNPKYRIDALFTGRINETKGIYDMLEVLDIVKEKYPDFQLAIIGEGEETIMRHFKEKIKKMDLEENIKFFGYVSEEDKFEIIKSSKVFWFLSISRSESWGVALLEAVCCGKPAFVYNLPAYKIYRNNEVFIFKIHDYKAVAAKVIEIFDKKEFENKKGELLIGEYSWEKIAETEYENIKSGIQKKEILPDIPPKILINGITLEGANIVPLLLKVKYWQEKNIEITFFGNKILKKQIDFLKLLKTYNFLELKNTARITGRIQLISEGSKRNIMALSYLGKLKNKFDVVYSISSVLDLLILPYVLKKADKRIKFVSVFDNTVPFIYSGNILISLLAWLFYQFSLLLLKDADYLFAVRQELKEYLLKKGFRQDRLVVSGNAVEMGYIRNAKKDNRYNIDALFVGRINEMKGIYDMLEVLKIVKVKYPNFQLALMGSGENATMRQYKEKINRLGLSGNIQFLGYKTGLEKFNIIKSSKCFWFLSHTESFPVAPLEAVCCGLKAIVYDLEAYDMYKNREMLMVKKKDYVTAAKKILEIFSNGNFENGAGKKLFHKMSWNWDKIAEIEYKALFQN